jgi:hypothetical protein
VIIQGEMERELQKSCPVLRYVTGVLHESMKDTKTFKTKQSRITMGTYRSAVALPTRLFSNKTSEFGIRYMGTQTLNQATCNEQVIALETLMKMSRK